MTDDDVQFWNCKCGTSYRTKPTKCTCGRDEPLWPSDEPTGENLVVELWS